jgi:hypothetical protein
MRQSVESPSFISDENTLSWTVDYLLRHSEQQKRLLATKEDAATISLLLHITILQDGQSFDVKDVLPSR